MAVTGKRKPSHGKKSNGKKKQREAIVAKQGFNSAKSIKSVNTAAANQNNKIVENLARQKRQEQMAVMRKQLKAKKIHAVRNANTKSASLLDMVERANQDKQQFHQKEVMEEEERSKEKIGISDASKRAYYRELRKVVEHSDVILEVLDARDPMGCRTFDIEERILQQSKKLILVLNKVDLVPHSILPPWLEYLRQFFPTVAFKASTQDQGRNLSGQQNSKLEKLGDKNSGMLSSSRSIGTDSLMQLLKNYCRSGGQMKTSITVGIIGYPNVGKSSLINSLKRSKAVGVSSTAGYTKVMQEIHLDKKIKLLDCPGIVFDESDSDGLLLRNCLNLDNLTNAINAVEVILSRCSKEQLMKLYSIDYFNDTVEFLSMVALKNGKLKKGGVGDRNAGVKIVLQDWNVGKIEYYTPPPEISTSSANSSVTNSLIGKEDKIVTAFGKEFDIDSVLNPAVITIPDEMATSKTQTDNAKLIPKCSLPVDDVNKKSINNFDSDIESDEETFDYNMEDNYDADSGNKAPVFIEDALNPQTAAIARRKEKERRKAKRKMQKQRIGDAKEDELNSQLNQIGF